MKKVQVKAKITTGDFPKYSTELSAGMDLRSTIKTSIAPMKRMLIPTRLYLELPDGYEAQVRPRSGLAIKKGITVLNTPGTIDADYRGEIGIILINLGDTEFNIEVGDRVAQLVINPIVQAEFVNSDLTSTDRGNGGFGHSGIK